MKKKPYTARITVKDAFKSAGAYLLVDLIVVDNAPKIVDIDRVYNLKNREPICIGYRITEASDYPGDLLNFLFILPKLFFRPYISYFIGTKVFPDVI